MHTTTTTNIHSFDVFDTVLTRIIGSPVSSFYLLGYKLKKLSLIDCSAESFARARAEAERRAFKNAGGLDSKVNINHIYAELQIPLRLNAAVCAQLIPYELELEQSLLRPVPQAKELIEKARNHNARVVFISDMYLDTGFIKKQLLTHDILQYGDLCYVSSDYAKSKHTGTLYQEVMRQEKITAREIIHCGNHPHADVKVAKRNGLQTISFYEGNLNRFEQILESQVWSTDGLSSAMAGASRLVRLSVKANSSKETHLRNASAGVAAPMLTGFVLWVLHRAQKLGLKRLYFVSRDGQILLEIAKRLVTKLNYECDLRYLYGSRQAWILPSMTDTTEEDISRGLSLEAHFVSAEAALDRLGIQPIEIKDKLSSIGLMEEKWAQNLSSAERKSFKKLILEDLQLQTVILERARQKRKIVIQYFRQEGLMEDIPYGMIDLGTHATLHCAMVEILRTENVAPPVSFYLGFAKSTLDKRFGTVEPYFFDKRDNTGFEISGLVEALEIVCSGDHGSVIGYQVNAGKVEPILTELRNHRVLDWGYGKIYETVCSFADQILIDPGLINPWADVRSVTFKAFEAFWLKPSYGEASAWGSFMMEDGWGRQAHWLRIAESYKWIHLKHILQKRQLQLRKHWWSWGALALTPHPLRSILTSIILSGKGFTYIQPRLKSRLKSFVIK